LGFVRTLKAAGGESRQVALRRNTEQGPCGVAQAGKPQRKICEMRRDAGDERCRVRPLVHKSEAIMAQGVALALVIVGEKFSLVGGEVDIHGTLSFAGLAGKA